MRIPSAAPRNRREIWPPLDSWAARHRITPRERAVAELVIQGLSNKQIATALGSAISTVRTQLLSICRKVGVTSRGELAHQVFDDLLAQIVEARTRAQRIFDTALDAILIADDSQRYIDANPAACALTGYTREELLRRSLRDLTPRALRAGAAAAWAAFIAAGKLEGEFELLAKDGRRIQTEFRAVANFLPGQHLSILREKRVSAPPAR